MRWGTYLGHRMDYARLLDSRYIGSFRGSTLEQLEQAAVDQGLYAQEVRNVTPRALLNVHYPIILFVRRDASSPYDHWVLCLGSHRGRLLVYDPPGGIREAAP